MRAFIDFEASSLARRGYPIEVAWVFEDGRSDSLLIAPVEGWTEWDPAAEAIHGISQAMLAREGVPAKIVAARLVADLEGHDVFAGAPSWDGKWLSALLGAGGFPRHKLRLTDTDVGLFDLASALLAPFVPSSEIHRAVRKILACAGDRFAGRRHAQRALADTEIERERWLIVSRLAHAYRRSTGGGAPHVAETRLDPRPPSKAQAVIAQPGTL
jgi:hypothetical protein